MPAPTFDPLKSFSSADAPTATPDAAAAAFDPSKPFDQAPDFKTTNEPPSLALKGEAWGKDLALSIVNSLPAAGAIVGGVLATPETAGVGTLPAAALGAGAGTALRNTIAAGLGLEKPSSMAGQAGQIAMSAAETYVAGKLLPAIWNAIKTPGQTAGEVYDGVRVVGRSLPRVLRFDLPKLPRGVGKAPASILAKPAETAWGTPVSEPPPPTGATGTSMIPAPVRPPQPVSAATPPVVAQPAAPAVAPNGGQMAPAASAATPAPFYPQKTLNEIAILAKRGKVSQLSGAEYQQGLDLVRSGLTPDKALEQIVAQRASASPTAAAEAFLKRPGVLSDADVQAALDARHARGEIKAPSAQTARARRNRK